MKSQKELNLKLLDELKTQKELTKQFKKDFEIEIKIKNGLYSFILENNLFDKLKEYETLTDYYDTDNHQKCLMWFALHLPESKKLKQNKQSKLEQI